MRFETKAIHAGQPADPRTGAVNIPVHLSTTFKQDGVGGLRSGYEYSRSGNPSRDSLEETIAALENARFAASFSSGLAATAAVLDLLAPGDEVVTTFDVYGGTHRLFTSVLARRGLRFRFLATASAGEILGAATPATKMFWIETPTNPLLNIIDIEALAAGRREGTLLVVDNTFATPFFQTPLDLGADVVVHSATKYLAGHSDVVHGVTAASDRELHQRIKFHQNAVGAGPGPFDCYLVQRGVKTLAVRMERCAANALRVAEHRVGRPGVAKVLFPWLPGHPGGDVARRQMRGPSGIVSFDLAGGRGAAEALLSRLEVFTLAESLGGVESLACHPYTMTHGSMPREEKARVGITEGLVRLSVGIEAIDDLLADLDQAFGALR